MTTTVGIDYSMSSPALCVHQGDNWDINNCDFYFFLEETKKNLKTFDDVWKSNDSSNKSDSPRFFPHMYPKDVQGFDRFIFLSNWVIQCLESYDRIDTIGIEGYAYGAGSSGGRVFEIGENTGLLKYRLKSFGYSFSIIPPTVIKKYATGKGNSNKLLLNDAFVSETECNPKSILNQSEKSFTPSSDIIDSYFIAMFVSSTSTTP